MANGVWITRDYPDGSTLEADSYAELMRLELEIEMLIQAANWKAKHPVSLWARIRTAIRRLPKC